MIQQARPALAAALIERTEAPQAPKTTKRKIALAGVCALAALTVAASNASATPLTQYVWTSTFADNGSTSPNNIAFTGSFSNSSGSSSGLYSAWLNTLSGLYTITNYLTICEKNGSSGTGTEKIAVTFNFTEPGKVSSTLNGSIMITGSQDVNGKVIWSNPDDIKFADGAELQIKLENVLAGTSMDVMVRDAPKLMQPSQWCMTPSPSPRPWPCLALE